MSETTETVGKATTAVAASEKANGHKAPPATMAMVKASNGEVRGSADVALSDVVILPDFNIDPKRMTDEASIRGLARSIEATGGLLQPVLIGAVTENGKTIYHLVNGFRRFAAYKMLGKKAIPATIREFDSLSALIANGAENTAREAVHPFHLAKRMQYLKDTHFKGDKEADSKIAEGFGVSKKHVQNLLRAHRNLAPKLRQVFEGPSACLDDESPSLKWLIEQAKESHEDQEAAYELRFGEGAKGDEEDEPKAKKKKDDGEEKVKKTRVRNRDEVLWAKDKTLKPLTDKQVEAGFDVSFKIRQFKDPKQAKITERDRIILKVAMAWFLDANREDFLEVTEPQEEEADE